MPKGHKKPDYEKSDYDKSDYDFKFDIDAKIDQNLVQDQDAKVDSRCRPGFGHRDLERQRQRHRPESLDG